ncbi:MAG: hypothetical protein KDE27_16410, partial [Planctomycetes bacterium]|nr:hypothetical protein [Planctomycetota bacterium]
QASWSAEVDALDPDLLVFQYGANAAWEGTSTAAAARLRQHSSDWLSRVRQDHPDRDCLVIGMLTRGDWVDGRATVCDSVPDVVAVQRETALAAGCAFWSAAFATPMTL